MSKGYEERYLMTLLSSVMNQKEPPAPLRYLNWEKLFRIADYHRVAHVVYYGIMGLDEEIPQPVRQHFFDKYLESVHRIERLNSAERQIQTIFERREINCFFLNYSDIVKCYPIEEMCCRESVEIGLKRKDALAVKAFFREADFEEKYTEVHGELYYKIPGNRVLCFNQTMFFSKSMQRFYINLFRALPNKNGFNHIREMNPTEMYLFFICRLTDSYARGDISLNQIIDFWVFYKTYGEIFTWPYIYEQLKKLKIAEFAEHLEYLILRWLGTGVGIENMEIYDAMESYVFSKGSEGREISAQLLPLITKVADCYARDRRAEELKRLVNWLFPDRSYMETIYPALEKSSILLPLFWTLRLGRYGIRVAVNGMEKGFLTFKKGVHRLFKRRNQESEEIGQQEEDGETEELNHEKETADIPK
ncbi:nucleotidyltransferase domain-containing protein [Lacrimispora sp.]|uniref:nucleotidyltransferase domain-containing protein n=1 Tax=Lacrimispora sp. TaxID=2719234 RepID=UPI002FD8CB2A